MPPSLERYGGSDFKKYSRTAVGWSGSVILRTTAVLSWDVRYSCGMTAVVRLPRSRGVAYANVIYCGAVPESSRMFFADSPTLRRHGARIPPCQGLRREEEEQPRQEELLGAAEPGQRAGLEDHLRK